jgi:hypothetical protein
MYTKKFNTKLKKLFGIKFFSKKFFENENFLEAYFFLTTL